MDIAKSVTYVFEDDKWISKLGIGILIIIASFLILPILLLFGWLVATTRNVMAGKEHPMADWDDWGQLFKDGGAIVGASIIYSSPFILLFIIGFIATIGLGGISEVNEDVAAVGFVATFGVLMCLGAIMALALFFISPAITIQYARTNDFSACFRFSEIIDIIRDNLGDIIIVALVPFGISIVASLFSFIPCIGWIVGIIAAPYQYAVLGHLYGQLALKLDGGKGSKFDTFEEQF